MNTQGEETQSRVSPAPPAAACTTTPEGKSNGQMSYRPCDASVRKQLVYAIAFESDNRCQRVHPGQAHSCQ
jgi:hypothetical protein